MILKRHFLVALLLMFIANVACSSSDDSEAEDKVDVIDPTDDGDPPPPTTPTESYADIDFSNWKVTLPVDVNNNGSADEYQPAVLKNGGYRTLEAVKPFMYDDTSDGSLIFYTYPGSTTASTSYSRTELRELINPTNSKENWSLTTEGLMQGRLKMDSISKDSQSSRTYHRTIVMQIHGIISIEDMAKHNFSSNNGPPLLKLYWMDGEIWAFKKSLVNEATEGDDLLDISSNTWTDIKHNLGYVGFEPFDFKIKASEGKLELQLNDETPFVYEDISLSKWPFENYFKAGNYLGSTAEGAFAYVKYYSLSVTH